MNYFILKRIRQTLAILYLILFSLLFVEVSGKFTELFASQIVFFQFIPSFLKFKDTFAIAASGFIIVFVISILFGRIYCSVLCPLGLLQDVIIRISKWIKIKKRFVYRKPSNFFRYSFLGLTILTFLAGSLSVINFLDPYSNFGRIFHNTGRFITMKINNFIAFALERFDIFFIYPEKYVNPGYFTILYAILFFAILLFLALFNGRFYCHTICPVGTFLGLFSRFSLFKIHIDEKQCTLCGSCTQNCKSECLDYKNSKIDMSRCIICFNCLDKCPEKGIQYSFIPHRKKEKKPDTISNNRRLLLTFFASAMANGLLAQKRERNMYGEEKNEREYTGAVCPPGSESITHFTQNCTACHLCVSACPTKVLQPSLTEYGWEGFLQPLMNYKVNYCNYDCTICGEVCPSGAIRPLDIEQKHSTQIGKVDLIWHECIVKIDLKDCGACSEHCPSKAVQMEEWKDGLHKPVINPEICVGCGACEHACPTDPRAIYVVSNPVHQIAKKAEKKEEKIFSEEDDFPF